MKIIECDGCQISFEDSFMWWNGYFWYCFECAIPYLEEEEERQNQEEEDLCSCRDGEINIYCQGSI